MKKYIAYSIDKYKYPNNTDVYKYRKLNSETEDSIELVLNYLKNTEDKVFIIDPYAYLIKLEANIPITKFDLLNNGNLGKNGEKKITKEIDEICKQNKCTFLLNENRLANKKLSQYNQYIYKHIINNYKERDNLFGLTIYKNY